MRILAGDIGGTKTLLQISSDEGTVEREQRFVSGDYATFDAMLGEFLHGDRGIDAACFAVAGPVADGASSITNLSWEMRESELQQAFGIERISLVNDFHAVARALPLLGEDDLVSINRGKRDPSAPVAILGAGTGLGQAILLPLGTERDRRWRVLASEGGHVDFAPADEVQIDLLRFLRERYPHVSAERVVSGMGIAAIYEFILHAQGKTLPDVKDIAAHVSEEAKRGDALAERAFKIFVAAYAAQAANLALTILAHGGVYLAGGIAAKNVDQFRDGLFMTSFARKGRFSEMMREFPVHIIANAKVGLIGARAIALEL